MGLDVTKTDVPLGTAMGGINKRKANKTAKLADRGESSLPNERTSIEQGTQGPKIRSTRYSNTNRSSGMGLTSVAKLRREKMLRGGTLGFTNHVFQEPIQEKSLNEGPLGDQVPERVESENWNV